MFKIVKYVCSICLGLLISVICLSLIFAGFYIHIETTAKWKYAVDDFELHKNDFLALADETIEFFEVKEKNIGKLDDSARWVSIMFDTEKQQHCFVSPKSERWYLSEHLTDCYKNVVSSFSHKDSKFDCIWYYDNRISFNIENGHYALVYSFNDEKPTFVNSPTECGKIETKKIEKNWYHVII